MARQCQVAEDSHREDVGCGQRCGVDVYVFGAHVAERPGLPDSREERPIEVSRETRVEDLVGTNLGTPDVPGTEISVDDVSCVQFSQAPSYVEHHHHAVIRRPRCLEQVTEILSGQVLFGPTNRLRTGAELYSVAHSLDDVRVFYGAQEFNLTMRPIQDGRLGFRADVETN